MRAAAASRLCDLHSTAEPINTSGLLESLVMCHATVMAAKYIAINRINHTF